MDEGHSRTQTGLARMLIDKSLPEAAKYTAIDSFLLQLDFPRVIFHCRRPQICSDITVNKWRKCHIIHFRPFITISARSTLQLTCQFERGKDTEVTSDIRIYSIYVG